MRLTTTASSSLNRALAAVFAALLGTLFALVAPLATQAAGCTSGTLIKGSGHAVYYCGADGKRYVFPNQKTYDTWYSDFSTVITISDSAMGSIPIGGNVTYKPGIRLVKITTSPTVYAVDANGALRAISSEAVAMALYGSTWNKQVDDVPDAFFVNYQLGADVTSASQFVKATIVAAATSINVDRRLANSGNGSTTGTNTGSSSQGVTMTISPDVSTLAAGQSATVTVSATDSVGISSLIIFSNGNPLKSCSLTSAPVTATCSVTINASDYPNESILSLYGQELNKNFVRNLTATRTITTSGGSAVAGSVTMSFSSNATTLNAGQSNTVTVNASDTAGISSVSIFVNGALVQNCNKSGSVTTASCSVTLYGSNYASGSSLSIYGQEVNSKGVPTISAATSLTVQVGNNGGGTVTLSFSPNQTTLAVGDTMDVQVQAYASSGVTTMSLYVNGSVVKTCSASGATAHANCFVTLSGSNYTSGQVITVYGQAGDTDGDTIVSPNSTITITPGTAVNGNVSLSFSPYANTLTTSQSTTVTVSATDSAKLSELSILVNGTTVRTCSLSGSTTSGTCSTTINGSSYSNGSTVTVQGQAVNNSGATSKSATSTLTISAASAGNGTVTLYLSPQVTSISGTQGLTITANAYDPAGLASINIVVNGGIVRTCTLAGLPVGGSCTHTLSASSYAHGTSLSIYGQGVNSSNAKSNSTATTVTVN